MHYATVAVVVDGALELEEECRTWEQINDIINDQARSAAEDGKRTQVWILAHDHPPPTEDEMWEGCSCSQYLADHHPYVEFNNEDRRQSPADAERTGDAG